MKIVLQRVSQARVEVNGQTTGAIDLGFLGLLGVEVGDQIEDLEYLVQKTKDLRVFADQDDKMNLALKQVDGALLLVSQFTLMADCKKGNRPSFHLAADPETAKSMYEEGIRRFRAEGIRVETGIFGAKMAISLINEGPVTICLDSKARSFCKS